MTEQPASDGVIDLGTFQLGQRLNASLTLPDSMSGVKRYRAKASGVPPGVRLGRKLAGKCNVPGTFTFEVRFTCKMRDGESNTYRIEQIAQQYRLTVAE